MRISTYEKEIEFDPKDNASWTGKGNVLTVLGRHEEALAAYEKALELVPEDDASWKGKGNALAVLGRYEEALVAYKEASRLDPEDSLPWNGKGAALYCLDRYDEAIIVYGKAIDLDPLDSIPKYNRAFLLFSEFDALDEALHDIRVAIHIHKHNADYWLLLSRIYIALGMTIPADKALLRFFILASALHIDRYLRILKFILQTNGHAVLILRVLALAPHIRKDDKWQEVLKGHRWKIEQWDALCRCAYAFSGGNAPTAATYRAYGLIHLLYKDRIAAHDAFSLWHGAEPDSVEALYFRFSCFHYLQGGIPELNDDITQGAVVAKARQMALAIVNASGWPESNAVDCLHLSLLLSGFGRDEDRGLAQDLLKLHPGNALCLAQLGWLAYDDDEDWEPHIRACVELEHEHPTQAFLRLGSAVSHIFTFSPHEPNWTEILLRLAHLQRFDWLQDWWEQMAKHEWQPDEQPLFEMWQGMAAPVTWQPAQTAASEEVNADSQEDTQAPPPEPEAGEEPEPFWKVPDETVLPSSVLGEMERVMSQLGNENAERLRKHLAEVRSLWVEKVEKAQDYQELISALDEAVNNATFPGCDRRNPQKLIAWCYNSGKILPTDAALYRIFIHVKNGGTLGALIRLGLRLSLYGTSAGLLNWLGTVPHPQAIPISLAVGFALDELRRRFIEPAMLGLVHKSAGETKTMQEFREAWKNIAQQP